MANLTINNKVVEIKGIEALAEVGKCSDNSVSYFLAIGLGILEVLASDKICPNYSLTLHRCLTNQIKQIEEIANSEHLGLIGVYKNIIDLVCNPEHEITDIMNWLTYYFSQNTESATDSLLIMIKYIIFISSDNSTIKAAAFNADSLTEELVEGYSKAIISSFPLFIRIFSADKEIVFTGGDSGTYPVINIFQEANSYSLAYFKDHIEMKNSSYTQRNLLVHPFIYNPMSPINIKKASKAGIWGAVPTAASVIQVSSNVVIPEKTISKQIFDLTKPPAPIAVLSDEESESSSDELDYAAALLSIKESTIELINSHEILIIPVKNDSKITEEIPPVKNDSKITEEIPPVPLDKPDLPPSEEIPIKKPALEPVSKVSVNLANIVSTISKELRENFLITDDIIIQLEKAVGIEPEIKKIPGIQEILNVKNEKFTEKQCKVCKLEKDRDEFTLINCDKGCKICSNCRAVKSLKNCLICRRGYDHEEHQLLLTLV